MSVCCCSLAGTAACQHCRNNPLATDVWSNTITTDHIEAKPFGNGFDVCAVCEKPSTIGKPRTNADLLRSMTDEELADVIFFLFKVMGNEQVAYDFNGPVSILSWLRQEVPDD